MEILLYPIKTREARNANRSQYTVPASKLFGFLIVKCTSGALHLKGFRRDVYLDDASDSDKSKLPHRSSKNKSI